MGTDTQGVLLATSSFEYESMSRYNNNTNNNNTNNNNNSPGSLVPIWSVLYIVVPFLSALKKRGERGGGGVYYIDKGHVREK